MTIQIMNPWLGPVHVVPGRRTDLLLLCDHASCAVPPELRGLGLDDAQRQRHIGWDIGALAVARHLARHFDAPLIHCGTSRLVVDANRDPDGSTLILAQSDSVFVPGNERLSDAERAQRIESFHRPYHAAIEQHLDAAAQAGQRPWLVSVHSFEPQLAEILRPWPIGVLWKTAREPVARLIEALEAQGVQVGDNEPYDGRVAIGYTLEHHAIPRGLPHVLLEIRNDLLGTEAGEEEWAQRLGRALVESGVATATL